MQGRNNTKINKQINKKTKEKKNYLFKTVRILILCMDFTLQLLVKQLNDIFTKEMQKYENDNKKVTLNIFIKKKGNSQHLKKIKYIYNKKNASS